MEWYPAARVGIPVISHRGNLEDCSIGPDTWEGDVNKGPAAKLRRLSVQGTAASSTCAANHFLERERYTRKVSDLSTAVVFDVHWPPYFNAAQWCRPPSLVYLVWCHLLLVCDVTSAPDR